jgi:transcriptional regulator with XRE-family HTH domain
MKITRAISKQISKLRKVRGETQGEFAKALSVTQPMVSAWEAVKGEAPSSGAYLRLGNLATYPENIWFWERAGIERQAMLSAFEMDLQERGTPPLIGEVIRIPRLSETLKGRESAGPAVPLPAEFIPNPGATICLMVAEASATVVDMPRGMFLLDTSIEGVRDLSQLWGRVVMVRHGGHGEGIEGWPEGLYVGRLTLERALGVSDGKDIFFYGNLAMLGREVGHYNLPLGRCVAPGAMTGYGDREDWARRIKEAEKLARAEMHLNKGIRILGKVIGHLTGHLEASGEGKK